jgi:hypothetical protein
MKITRRPFLLPLPALLGLVLLFSSCQKAIRFAEETSPVPDHSITVRFKPTVDGQPLVYGDNYINTFGEPYSVSAFKFYISNIYLVNTVSGTSQPVSKDEYFLADFADTNTARFQWQAVSGTYNRLVFVVGVDSIRNVSGAQTGALDPAKGMFWTWNSGYIMAKLEGNSPVSNQPNNAFEYHIGGFSGPNNVVKPLTLSFPLAQDITLQAGRSSQMTITADVNAWFDSPNNIQLSVNPVCMTPGALARQISENYMKMFNITNIVTQ